MLIIISPAQARALWPLRESESIAEEIRQQTCQPFRIVLVNHVTGIIDLDEALIAKSVQARLFIRAPGLVAFFPFNYQDWAVDSAEEFDRLE